VKSPQTNYQTMMKLPLNKALFLLLKPPLKKYAEHGGDWRRLEGLWDHLCVAGIDKDLPPASVINLPPASAIEVAMKFDWTIIITTCKHDRCRYYPLSMADNAHFASP
jgi:hypothetical protein